MSYDYFYMIYQHIWTISNTLNILVSSRDWIKKICLSPYFQNLSIYHLQEHINGISDFSSTYSCEPLFSVTNFIKSGVRNRLTDEWSAEYTLLKVTYYEPNIYELTSNTQQQKSNQLRKLIIN